MKLKASRVTFCITSIVHRSYSLLRLVYSSPKMYRLHHIMSSQNSSLACSLKPKSTRLISDRSFQIYHLASFLSKNPFKMAIKFSNALNQTLKAASTFELSSPSLT
ncbi:hypothetical protein EYC80_002074 [Monilinia laxa]|uniref:Uncharacterized protein n=1 Tax=Monilinia laxa TaxID=61186 RepID=A0A5N6K6W3_MONLA|nr:hypothetical protein EYC80_002074 [Monilinia laxa]